MAATNGYCVLADITGPKDITSIDAADDTRIEGYITSASRFIDEYAGHRFYVNSSDETRVYTAEDGSCVQVDDLVSVTTLKIDVDLDRVYEYTLATTDYDLLPGNAALKGKPYTRIEVAPAGLYSFPTQAKGVQVVGKFGYPAVPADIKQACIMITIRLYQNRFGQNVDGPATITAAGVVITPSDIPSDALKILNLYKPRC